MFKLYNIKIQNKKIYIENSESQYDIVLIISDNCSGCDILKKNIKKNKDELLNYKNVNFHVLHAKDIKDLEIKIFPSFVIINNIKNTQSIFNANYNSLIYALNKYCI
ncbi:hypothetical protein Hokovirus_3_150 [Hokovirus HKV1]|uniref:Thioredoxin n=1 Tax=Hokovirus HKV1 TaxID=1977638 RepID=A0A1V0SGN2_9VIRU|nr:hypothetical protein Hokovirus_3_150 [Hokovirus HKV1]